MNFPSSTDLAAEQVFVTNLLQWYKKNHRDLPWRQTQDPYAIWISETMLQQTQVATVIPYWNRWLARFPDIRTLAAAPVDDVLQEWQGLGYYSRARNLHRAAQMIVEKHGGLFPERYEEVLALPGVGRYTAGAVCSIALGLDTPIVDANVIRVLCRVFGVRGDPKSSATQADLWERAERLIPTGEAGVFNQAMMELGALICATPPRCEGCPVQADCFAYSTGVPSTLPEFAPKPEFTTQTDVCAVVSDAEGRLLLVQRPLDAGLWAGLWELPRVTAIEEELIADAAVRALQETVGMTEACVEAPDPIAKVRHGVTTRKITLLALPVRWNGIVPVGVNFAWATPTEALDKYALASPQRRLLEKLREARQATVIQPTLF